MGKTQDSNNKSTKRKDTRVVDLGHAQELTSNDIDGVVQDVGGTINRKRKDKYGGAGERLRKPVAFAPFHDDMKGLHDSKPIIELAVRARRV